MHKARKHRVGDLSLYLVISVSIIGAVFATASLGVAWNVVFTWFCVATYTLLLFGYFIADSRLWWQKRSFWLLMLVTLSLHLICLALLIQHFERFRPFWFIAAIPEFIVLVICRNAVLPSSVLGHQSKGPRQL
jgi:hypothetical protein